MITLRLGRWQDALKDLDRVDALVADGPYSVATHEGHNKGVRATRLDGEKKRVRVDRRDGSSYSVGASKRREIDYKPMGDADAIAFVEHWSPRVRGWFCVITDDVLAQVFKVALRLAGRVTFAPLPCVDKGCGVRLAGDGPSSWTRWLVVARPKTRAMAKWGTLRGFYERGRRPFERPLIIGGKPLWLMHDIVADYTRPGDLVVDPFAGSGTTLIAAHDLGRRAIGAELNPETYALARARIGRELGLGELARRRG